MVAACDSNHLSIVQIVNRQLIMHGLMSGPLSFIGYVVCTALQTLQRVISQMSAYAA